MSHSDDLRKKLDGLALEDRKMRELQECLFRHSTAYLRALKLEESELEPLFKKHGYGKDSFLKVTIDNKEILFFVSMGMRKLSPDLGREYDGGEGELFVWVNFKGRSFPYETVRMRGCYQGRSTFYVLDNEHHTKLLAELRK